jgi:hypothetical protein
MSDLGCDIVTVTVPDPLNVEAAEAQSLVASVTAPEQPSVQVFQPPTTIIAVIETGPPGPPGPPGVGGEGSMTGNTVDTGEPYKVILFSNGQARAIPVGADPPATPTGLARTVKINSVRLTWTPVQYGPSYVVYRNGSPIATVSTASFQDTNVTIGQTYTYAVQSIDVYGLRSGLSSTVSAFIDPALNVAPTIEVRSWPTSVALGNRAIIRVNAKDLDSQALALALNVNVGSLVATADPSVWILIPV